MKKQSYTAIISAHKAAIPQIQAAVSALDKSGLAASGTSVKLLAEGDLVSFRDRAMIIAEEDAKQIKSAHTRKMLTKESLEYMNGVIVDSARVVREALRLDEEDRLDYSAYDIQGGEVVLSPEWLENKNREKLIEESQTRGRIMQLFEDLKRQIEEVNAFVADNQYYGRGLLPENNDMRCIIRLGDTGELYFDREAFDYLFD